MKQEDVFTHNNLIIERMMNYRNVIICLIFSFIFSNCIQINPNSNKTVKRKYNDLYIGKYADKIAFPIGGIGSGMFCLDGNGGLSNMSICGKPDLNNEPTLFAAISLNGFENGAKIIEGRIPDWKIYGITDSGVGHVHKTYGLPRFKEISFLGRFSFGKVSLSDPKYPIKVNITGWSPFIPTDPDNSSLPVGALEYNVINCTDSVIHGVFSFNSANFLSTANTKSSVKRMENGFILGRKGDEKNLRAEFAIFTDNKEKIFKNSWFRGDDFHSFEYLWEQLSSNKINNVLWNNDALGASILIPFTLNPKEDKSFNILMAWYAPETAIRYGRDLESESDKDWFEKETDNYYKPWYSIKFNSLYELCSYWLSQYKDFRKKSELFTNAFYNSTLPKEVIEAVSANLSILKSPTILRLRDGSIWSYEGCNDNEGSCYGSSSHVWNYAQAIPHLFPSLERSYRNIEFFHNQDYKGHQNFRVSLPIRPDIHNLPAAADGQLGGVIKVYREWRISGDDDWLSSIYPKLEQSLNYCIDLWDPLHKGVLEEPHHGTYDAYLWGADAMSSTIYSGALMAFIKMSEYLGKDATSYKRILEKGKFYIEDSLYNGEYFIQKIKWKGLSNTLEAIGPQWRKEFYPEEWDLMKKEGPKYQYGDGCLSDGVMGIWLSQVCGLKPIIDNKKVLNHIHAVYKYNFLNSYKEHINPYRGGFAINEESGLINCSWPKGGKPTIPLTYYGETWSGVEYQVASHLILNGEVEKGLNIVRACRDRYNGLIRNPFDEYECGHWYARALSSYALLEALTGVRYDAVEKALYINSKVGDFVSFLSTHSGFGNIYLKKGIPEVKMVFGSLLVDKIIVNGNVLETKSILFRSSVDF